MGESTLICIDDTVNGECCECKEPADAEITIGSVSIKACAQCLGIVATMITEELSAISEIENQ